MKRVIPLIILCFAFSCQNKPAVPKKTLKMTDAMGELCWASSQLDRTELYSAENIFDQDSSTAWAEGKKGDGIGESIIIVSKGTVQGVEFVNGHAINSSIFQESNRIKDLKISVYKIMLVEREAELGEELLSFSILLQDKIKRQKIVLPKKVSGHLAFKFTIESVYQGDKFQDTYLSDLKLIKIYQKIAVRNNKHEVWVGSKLAVKNLDENYELVEVSGDGAWAIIMATPKKRETGGNRYYLFSAEEMDFLPVIELDRMYGFKIKGDKLFLEGFSVNQNKVRSIQL